MLDTSYQVATTRCQVLHRQVIILDKKIDHVSVTRAWCRMPFIRLPQHNARHSTYRTSEMHQSVTQPLTRWSTRCNKGCLPVIAFTRLQCWTPSACHSTVPDIWPTPCQSRTKQSVDNLPLGLQAMLDNRFPTWGYPPGGHASSIQHDSFMSVVICNHR